MEKMKVFKENIFSWYDFKPNATGIVYAQDEDYVEILRKKINIVTEQTQKNLDYIIFVGENSVFSKIQNLTEKLMNDTKIIVIQENDLSIKNISTYPNSEEILQKNELNTIIDLEKQMKKFDFSHCNLYYAFPNYDFVEILLEENYEIGPEQIDKYMLDTKETQIKTLNEKEFLKKLLQVDKKLLKIFANSFFAEFSKKERKQDVQFVSFNNVRKEEYRLMTVIRNEVVEKLPISQKATKHLENMKQNIKILQSQNLNLLDYEENGKCYSKLIKNHSTLDVILAENSHDLENVACTLTTIKNILLVNTIDYNEEVENALKEYQIDCSKIKKLRFLKHAFIDFVPKNCFKIDHQFYFFDQEWEREFLPVDFILYRAIINSYDLVKKINIDDLYKKMNLTEFIETFEKINQKIMKDILDQELYEKIISKTIKRMDNIVNERKIAFAQIADFKAEDLKKTELIENLQTKIIPQMREEELKKEKVIQGLEQEEAKKDQIIETLKQEEKRKEDYIKVLENVRIDKENEIANLNAVNMQKDETIQNLNEIIKVKENQIALYENMKMIKIMKKLRGKK